MSRHPGVLLQEEDARTARAGDRDPFVARRDESRDECRTEDYD
ncbi:hypothetical protein ACWD3J_13085 [Streptomyces sp. NPDC002755]